MHTWRAIVRPVTRFIRSRLIGNVLRSGALSYQHIPRSFGRIVKHTKPSFFARLLVKSARSGASSHIRALGLGLWRQSNGLRRFGAKKSSFGLNYVTQLNTTYNNTGIFERVRDLFTEPPAEPDITPNLPHSISSYNIGSLMAVGCNAAVYEAKLPAQILHKLSLPPYAPAASDINEKSELLNRKNDYNLAIKMAFNYHATSNQNRIVREMAKEMVPVLDPSIKGDMKWDKPLPHGHVNIAKVYTAFVDLVPDLKEAAMHFCWALPPSLHVQGVGYSKTLFLVMKRYTMTLKEYLTWQGSVVKDKQERIRTLLLAQLLEALVFLNANNVVHRDIKSNNILVDFDFENEPPHLVLCDFGCCLSEGSTMTIPYAHMDQDLGGNVALLPPEIKNQSPGHNKWLNYGKCDLWAAGTMAYEIYCGVNPFYMAMDSKVYREKDLPVMPKFVPKPVQVLVDKMLKRNPSERPSICGAADVVGLSLLRVNDYLLIYNNNLVNTLPSFIMANINRVLLLYSAETILSRKLSRSHAEDCMSKAECQLRKTLLSRIDLIDLKEALSFLNYFET